MRSRVWRAAVGHGDGELAGPLSVKEPLTLPLEQDMSGQPSKQSGGLEAAAVESLSPRANTEARQLLARFIEHHLGRPLVSSKFLDEVAPEIGGGTDR